MKTAQTAHRSAHSIMNVKPRLFYYILLHCDWIMNDHFEYWIKLQWNKCQRSKEIERKKGRTRSAMITFAINHQYISLDVRCIHFIDYIETGWQRQDCERQLQCCGLWYGHKISDWLCFCDDFFLHCIELARSPFNRRTWKYCILLYFNRISSKKNQCKQFVNMLIEN